MVQSRIRFRSSIPNDLDRRYQVWFIVFAVAMFTGCAALPLKEFQPVIAPPSAICDAPSVTSLRGEPKDGQLRYLLPYGSASSYVSFSGAPGNGALFETYYSKVRDAVKQKRLPAGIEGHKVTKVLVEWLASVSGAAQLDGQIAHGGLKETNHQVALEREAIKKHGRSQKLSHGDLKDFASKLFDLQKQGASSLVGYAHAKEIAKATNKYDSSFDQNFVRYFEAYYKGNFVDRMGAAVDKPQISTTIPDSEIAAAETVMLEFLVDLIDSTPVMGNDEYDKLSENTKFYPGNSKKRPTALTKENYLQLPAGSPDACGITQQNAWVLRDLANAASSQAAAVGGLVENTAGGVSIGLGVLGKISIGDNQTLSVLVKTAASRVALRATLTSSYETLRHFKFNVSEP
jgi:hypothetical protein